MKIQTLSQAYGANGGETHFTRVLANSNDMLEYLFDECNFPFPESISTEAESLTDSSKRVDVLVYDNDETDTVIECMSMEGKLDPVHVSKITYYMHTKGVTKGILLCDYAPNETKSYIRDFINLQTNLSIAIVEMRFIDKMPIFTAVERPMDSKEKKQTQNNAARSTRLSNRQKLFDTVVDLPYVFDYAPSDDAVSLSLDSANAKWSYKNVIIVPQTSKTTVMLPKSVDENLLKSAFPEGTIRHISGKLSENRYAYDLPVEYQNDFRAFVESVYNAVTC